MQIENYKQIGRGFLVGRFDIRIDEWGGLQICDCLLFEKDGRRWVSLPSKEYEKDGAKKHYNLIRFNEEVFRRLQKVAVDQIGMIISTQPEKEQQTFKDQTLPF